MIKELRVSLIQFEVDDDSPQANVDRVRALADQMDASTHIFCLPELWTRTFRPHHLDLAEDFSDSALEAVCDICRRQGAYAVAGSLSWPRDGGVSNRAWVVNDAGQPIAWYDKTHLFTPSGERDAFVRGDSPLIFTMDNVRCAVAICYDMRFPEYMRAIAMAGAQVVFLPGQWPRSRRDAWPLLLKAIAANCQMYVVACNNVGTSSARSFFGESMIISPRGIVLAEMGESEGVLSFDLDVDEVAKSRSNLPLNWDRRPELYGLLSEPRG